jgi:hypothetical protein
MRLRLLLWSVGLVTAVLAVGAASTFAPSFQGRTNLARADGHGGIEVADQGVQSQFPNGVRFSLTARSPDQIDDIRVFFRKADQRNRAYGTVEFARGNEVRGEYLLRSGGGGGFIPPGTQIDYSFEVRDKGGRVHRTPEQRFIYLDNRFEWRTVSDGLTTVYYYGEFVEKRAQTVLEAAQETLKQMGPVLGIQPIAPLRIVTYNNYRHMVAALPFRSQAVSEQLQTEGQAFSEERVLLVLGVSPTIRGITSHEFTHLLVAEAAGGAISQVPAWLNEGLAEYANLEPTDSYERALRNAIFTRRLRPLWYQRDFGGKPEDIIIAYGQGRSVVQFLVAKHGPAKIAELMRALQKTLDIDKAMEEVYGFDQHGLDSQWRMALGLEPLPPPRELERQLQARAEATPTPDPTPTPTPEPTPVAAAGRDAAPRASPGCSAPNRPGATAGDLASLVLLAGPVALLFRPRLRRR